MFDCRFLFLCLSASLLPMETPFSDLLEDFEESPRSTLSSGICQTRTHLFLLNENHRTKLDQKNSGRVVLLAGLEPAILPWDAFSTANIIGAFFNDILTNQEC